MPTDILMPKLADTLVEGTLLRWLRAANDVVQAGEPIAEIETDKVTTELTAPGSGMLSELLVLEGETVPIGTPVARMRATGEQELSPSGHETPDTTQETPFSSPARRASPLASRIAQAHDIDLARVAAPGSRITRVDVERHLAARPLPAFSPQFVEQKQQQVPSQERDTAMSMPSASLSPPVSSPVDEVLPLTGLRRATAARMSSVRLVPTGCAVVEADVTELEQFYRKERDAWLTREGFPLTYTPFFLYALAQSLRAWPSARQMLRNNQREPRDAVHVGVAVALEDGLIVPVIRDADRQDIRALARTQADLVARARAHRLRPDEVVGGVASLTNVGSVAGLLAFPMLNEQQAIILGIGALTRRAIGDSAGIHYRSCVYLSLTFDRRLLDDLQAEHFLLDVSHSIVHPAWPGEQSEVHA
ncbi:MAG: dihydrolipoamide acetyltransferase family protein [Ktedonobacteraceae bacterium]